MAAAAAAATGRWWSRRRLLPGVARVALLLLVAVLCPLSSTAALGRCCCGTIPFMLCASSCAIQGTAQLQGIFCGGQQICGGVFLWSRRVLYQRRRSEQICEFLVWLHARFARLLRENKLTLVLQLCSLFVLNQVNSSTIASQYGYGHCSSAVIPGSSRLGRPASSRSIISHCPVLLQR